MTLLHGATCISVTAGWCTLCEVEMQALAQLEKDYAGYVQFITIDLDSSWSAFDRYARAHDPAHRVWLYAGDDPAFMDELRMRSIPAFFLLNDRTIAQAPAPLPSQGMAEIFFKLKAETDQRNRAPSIDGPPPKH
jgi:thiol-disulfide isomerase/thioredoxin